MELCRAPGTRVQATLFEACRIGACGLLLAAACGAAPAQTRSTQLAELSLEQLSDLVVTTVSRFDERLDQAAASVYVITADDIRRSGATTLAEALRLAPTLDIARADSSQYAMTHAVCLLPRAWTPAQATS